MPERGAAKYTCYRKSGLKNHYRVNCAEQSGFQSLNPMLRSMTAYGRGSSISAGGEIVCEFRSVNHRYLDVTVRLPEPFRALDAALRGRLVGHLSRGKVDVTIKLSESGSTHKPLTINTSVLDSLLEATNHITPRVNGDSVVDVVKLLQWPGVLEAEENSHGLSSDDVSAAFDSAFNDFVETRQREGLHVAQLLETRVGQVSECVEELRSLRPVVVQRQRENWLAKLAEIATEYDQSRLEQELVYVAQRLDIDEELDRLDAHCVEIRKALKREEPVGRRLDFLMQECNREANTISSKSNDARTTNASVNMKVLIEQMREQVQNIE